jgi:hypothetical protein
MHPVNHSDTNAHNSDLLLLSIKQHSKKLKNKLGMDRNVTVKILNSSSLSSRKSHILIIQSKFIWNPRLRIQTVLLDQAWYV